MVHWGLPEDGTKMRRPARGLRRKAWASASLDFKEPSVATIANLAKRCKYIYFIYVLVSAYTYICAYMCIHMYTYVYIYICIYTYTYI